MDIHKDFSGDSVRRLSWRIRVEKYEIANESIRRTKTKRRYATISCKNKKVRFFAGDTDSDSDDYRV